MSFGYSDVPGFGSATHEQVAEEWARQSGKRSKGKRMYYEGATLYSHGTHYLLGFIEGNRAFINEEKWMTITNGRYAREQESVSTKRHCKEAWGAARKAGLVIVPSLDPERADPFHDVEGFCMLARQAMGERKPCGNANRLWEAREHIGNAMRAAKAIIGHGARAMARQAIAKVLLDVRAGHNAIRLRAFNKAMPHAFAMALGLFQQEIAAIVSKRELLFRLRDGRLMRLVKSRDLDFYDACIWAAQ